MNTMNFWENAIYFENVRYGLEHYDNEIVKLGEEEALLCLEKKLEEAEKGSVYADFYYKRLDLSSKQIIENALTEEEKQYIQQLVPIEEESVIYPLDQELLQMIVKLNAKEILFSTIYFTGQPEKRSTWWGNYNQEYIVFREKEV